MKKFRNKLIIAIIVLTLAIIPIITNADTTATYDYQHYYFYYSDMKSAGELSDISALSSSGFYVNNKKHSGYSRFFAHFAKRDGKNYLVYCKDMGKFANASLDGYDLTGTSNNGSISSASGLTAKQRELLEDLLSNGYHYDQADAAGRFTTKTQRLSVMAMQFLVWEITEGARTDWNASGSGGDAYAPARPQGANHYDKVIRPNGCPNAPSGTAQAGSLCAIYRSIIDNVRKATKAEEVPAFGQTYMLKWDNAKNSYYKEISNIGSYKTCTSNNNKVTVKVSGSKLILTSTTSNFNGATITCSYSAGQGTSSTTKPFVTYEFKSGHSECNGYGGCQGFIYGGGTKTYSKTLTVYAEKAKVKVVKKNADGAKVSEAEFNLKLQGYTPGYNIKLAGNGDAKNITASGTYTVSETKVPSGYDKIADFEVSLDLINKKVTGCTNKGTDGSGNVTCLNGQVTVKVTPSSTHGEDLFTFTIIDTARNFKIKKVDVTGKNGVRGATFQIKDSKGNVVKFKESSGIFTYNTAGTVTDIRLADSYSYPISLLPNGNYTIVETAVPAPYTLPEKESERTTQIKITDGVLYVYDTSQKKYVIASDASVKIKNYKTEVNILKTGNGKSLQGVVFSLLKEDKSTYITANETAEGSGSYNYSGTTTDMSERTTFVTNAAGKITVNRLPEGKYYFKEEQTVPPFEVPTGDAAYTEVTIEVTKDGVKVNNKYNQNTIGISNSANSFNFYKVDEDGNYLKSGKFKIQKWDDEKNRYIDMKVAPVQNDGTYDENADIFEPSDNGKIKFGLTNGIATFINMPSGSKYRIIETEAPDGYVLGDANDGAEVTIDRYGNSSGLLILTNQKISKEDGDAKAELILNIATGQEQVNYPLIIGGIVVILGVLLTLVIIANKKGQKK